MPQYWHIHLFLNCFSEIGIYSFRASGYKKAIQPRYDDGEVQERTWMVVPGAALHRSIY